jgi:hypothetical protein
LYYTTLTQTSRHINLHWCVDKWINISIYLSIVWIQNITFATAAVAGRLDYCKSVLYGSSVTDIQKLQRVQNSFARAVTRFRRSEHITSSTRQDALAVLYPVQTRAVDIQSHDYADTRLLHKTGPALQTVKTASIVWQKSTWTEQSETSIY